MKKNVTPSLGGVERRDWNLFEVLLVVARVVMVLALWGALVMVGPQVENIGIGWFVTLTVVELLILAFGTWRWVYGQVAVKEILAEWIVAELVHVVPIFVVVLVVINMFSTPTVSWQSLLIMIPLVIWLFAHIMNREFTRQPADRYEIMRGVVWSVQALGIFWAVWVVYSTYLTTLTNSLQATLTTITLYLAAGFIAIFGCLGAYTTHISRWEQERELLD